jgi:hypothetical protein
MAGQRGARFLTRLIAGRSLVNLELHPMDAADAEEDGLEALRVPAQPDLRLRASEKLANLRAALEALNTNGYEFVTLRDAARVFGPIAGTAQ